MNLRPRIYFLFLFAFLTLPYLAQAQIGNGANFGIDGDVISDTPAPGTDDWFRGPNGLGVISLDSLELFQSRINNRENVDFHTRMSAPTSSMIDGRFWYSALYAHDYVSIDSKKLPTPDLTAFLNGENSDDPATWEISERSIPPKADIMDAFFHVRRDGTTATDSLWLSVAVATMDNGGSHYVDVEFFIEPLEISGSNFVNLGPDGGHTAWKFDNLGNILQIGDIDLGLDYAGSTVLSTDVRIWISRTDFQNNRGFQYIDFHGANDTSPYGYARLDPNGSRFGTTNLNLTQAPPWGTYSSGLNPSTTYEEHALGEMSVNLTGMGLDPADRLGTDLYCSFPYRALLIKSRTSGKFTSNLVDYLGPYPLPDDAASDVDTSIASVPPFDSCDPGVPQTLEANTLYPFKDYRWRSLTPGVTFPDGSSEITGIALDRVEIDTPGEYELNITAAGDCIGDPFNASTIRVLAQPCAVEDDVAVQTDSSIVIETWENDIDLDSNIDPVSVDNTGLLAPSNGSIALSPATGEITYTPNPGFTGTDVFEYRICDYDGLCDIGIVTVEIDSAPTSPFADSDGDGILDKDDLDDDNDGIPDAIEQGVIIDHSQPACGGETTLDFSSPAVLISGTDKQVGAVYRISNVTAGTDALVSVTQIYNATIFNIDNNSSDAHAFRPDTGFSFVNAGDQAMIEYKIRFVASGNTTPVVIDKIFMNFNDIDGTNAYAEQTWALNPTNYVISNPTELTMYTDGNWVVGTAGTNTYGGASNSQPAVNFGASYNSKSEMTIRVGAVARVAGANSIQRLHHIEFECITNYINPDVFGMDFDYDGVANHLDLDSDNDGIYDAFEAGHGQTDTSGIIAGPYGSNGLADSVEDLADSGNLNYSIRNTEALEGDDYLDTDADNDVCSDANEAYNSISADGGDNYFYDIGNPPAVDDMGRVISALYTTPVDSDMDGNPEFRQFNAPIVNQHPADQYHCPGDTVNFTIDAENVDSYQWQYFNGFNWTDIADGGKYSGVTTATLTISDVGMVEDGLQVRALLSHPFYICYYISDTAQLTVEEINVTANASSTSISPGESVILTGSGADSYTWDQGVSDGVPITLFDTTTFTVTGTSSSGCTDTDSVTIYVGTTSDLSLSKNVSNDFPYVGEVIQFTLNLTNSGPDGATNVVVEDVLPSGYTFVIAYQGGTLTGNTIQWNIPYIDIETLALTYLVEVNAPTGSQDEYKNIAQITASDQDDPDSGPGNDDGDQNEDDETSYTLPTPGIDLSLNKSSNRSEASVGDEIVFTVEVTNSGNMDATNVEVLDLLPEGFDLVGVDVSQGTFDEATWTWSLPLLPSGGSATMQMLVTVTEIEDYTNIAEIAYADQFDPNPMDNRDEVAISMLDMNCLVVYNEFSPNNDGANEFLYIECIEQYPDNIIQVYDRWGTLVYRKNSYDNSWDGTRQAGTALGNNSELPVGTYYYVLQLDKESSRTQSGWIYISR